MHGRSPAFPKIWPLNQVSMPCTHCNVSCASKKPAFRRDPCGERVDSGRGEISTESRIHIWIHRKTVMAPLTTFQNERSFVWNLLDANLRCSNFVVYKLTRNVECLWFRALEMVIIMVMIIVVILMFDRVSWFWICVVFLFCVFHVVIVVDDDGMMMMVVEAWPTNFRTPRQLSKLRDVRVIDVSWNHPKPLRSSVRLR